ncbi:MAG: VCBS repeat-containing protein, partial [Verrucomicrobia bacterium]|nr:VCBS repeat-containing protein [Verrucomicrobiota bacterium]
MFLVPNAGAQLFDNLVKFVDRIGVGDPAVNTGREGPKGLALVDFDADGKLDVATSNLDGTISVAYGQGGLAFDPAVHLRTVSLTLRQLIAADVNGDSRPDLLAAGPHEGLVHVFINQGSRRFVPGAPIVAWPTSRNIATGDYNGDGKLDVAVSGRERGVVLYAGDGVGGFSEMADAGPELGAVDSQWGFRPVYSLESVRAPGAAMDQLLVTHANSWFCWTLAGDGTILNKATLSHQAHALTVGIVTANSANGVPSVATSDKTLGTVELRLLKADSWAAGVAELESAPHQVIRVPGAPRYVQLADLNNDGWNDMVVVLRNFDRVLTYKNEQGTMVASSEMPVGTSPRELAAGDLNADGLTDFVVINSSSADVSALLASEQGTGFQALDQVYPETGEVSALDVRDLNGDGRDDIIQTHRASGDVSVRISGPGGKLKEPMFFPMGTFPSSLDFRDINGDGIEDISTANLGRDQYVNGSVSVRLGNPDGSFQDLLTFDTADGGRVFAIAAQDFNNDGMTDFAVGYFDCRLSFYKGIDASTFEFTRTVPFIYEPRVMTAGDFDQDGDYDIAGAGYAGDVVVLESDGNLLTRTGQRRDYGASSSKIGTREITQTDVNGDGDPDLLLGTGDGVVVYAGGPGTSFHMTSDKLPGTDFPASSLVTSDFDNDGKDDIAVSCRVLS